MMYFKIIIIDNPRTPPPSSDSIFLTFGASWLRGASCEFHRATGGARGAGERLGEETVERGGGSSCAAGAALGRGGGL